MLRVSLLLGLFLFSGYNGKTADRYRQPVQTSWHYTNNIQRSAVTASYKKAATALYASYHDKRNASYKLALITYRNRIELRLAEAEKIFSSTSSLRRFASVKSVPANSEEDSPFSKTV